MKHETKHTETTVHWSVKAGGIITLTLAIVVGMAIGWAIWG